MPSQPDHGSKKHFVDSNKIYAHGVRLCYMEQDAKDKARPEV